jgi:hypothetical protein
MAEQLNLFNEEQLGALEYETYNQTEWCFQFFDNEPIVFGWDLDESKSSPMVIELKPQSNNILTFTQKGMTFKIFPREMSEESKLLREEQKQQNASQNQEAAQ